jgi:hypothetical protein
MRTIKNLLRKRRPLYCVSQDLADLRRDRFRVGRYTGGETTAPQSCGKSGFGRPSLTDLASRHKRATLRGHESAYTDDHYLLYIDVLGFGELVEKAPKRVEDLFQIVASLNAHDHEAFAAIAFSDTILVHDVALPSNDHDREYVVMYQCEFFQDLLRRVAGRGISLRAVLTYGPFEHYLLNGTPYFYGPAVNYAYRSEKGLQITGLLMDEHCLKYSNIFSSRPFDDHWHYVFVTQGIDDWEDQYGAVIPLPRIIVDDTDLGWNLGPEIETVAFSARQAREHPDPRVRAKHIATLQQYRRRYPKCFAALESTDFRMEAISTEFDWTAVRARMLDSYSWASVRRSPRGGSHRRRRS